MSDWWANKLGTKQQPQGGIVLQPQPQAQPVPHYPQQQYQQPQPYQPPQQHLEPYPGYDDPNRKLTLREAVTRFRGGEGVKTEGHLSCPSCGSKTGFTAFSGMSGMSAGVMGNRPAPHCFECGYNGKFSQGDQANWA